MQYRQLGKTGLRVSVIGLGCAQLGSSSIAHGVAIVERAIELGVTYFDVARVYDDAEVKVGLAAESVRSQVVISTKADAVSREDAWREINESLERLRTDYVDNLHMHAVASVADLDARMADDGAFQALLQAKEEGMAHHIGLSSHRSDNIIAALKRYPFEVILIPMNIVEREPLSQLIPLCQARGVGVTIMKPVGTGIFPPSLALRWMVNQPIATAVPGVTCLSELEENVLAGEVLPLSAQDEQEIAQLQREFDRVRCRICQECEPCPKGVPIGMTLGTDMIWDHLRNMGPEAFFSFPWGRAAIEIDLPRRKGLIASLEACDNCGLCVERCPYGLPVTDRLMEMLPGHRQIVAHWEQLLAELD